MRIFLRRGLNKFNKKKSAPNLNLLLCVSTTEKETIEATDVTAYDCFNVFTLPNFERWKKKSSDKYTFFQHISALVSN